MSLSAGMTVKACAPETTPPLLDVVDLYKTFSRTRQHSTRALAGVSFSIGRGEILGVVGESGCGKSTLARIVVGLEEADAGTITLAGRPLVGGGLRRPVPPSKRAIQMVFQDPYSSLNPRMQVREIVGEGLAIRGLASGRALSDRVAAGLQLVGLRAEDLHRYAHQFSGGQRQRIGIARALILEPQLLIADEPVSALDVSVQMQILNLLLDIRERLNIGILFITHDIGVVRYLCDRVIVLSSGTVVESGVAATVISDPQHPYTKRLIAAVPHL